MNLIRVIIADDHTLVRAGMRLLLENAQGIKVVAEACNGREALCLIAEHAPNVVLMDISMPGMNGLEATARIEKDFPEVRVLILSVHKHEEYVLQALQGGAAGYLLKDASAEELELAVKAVARGESYLSPAISKQVIDDYVRRVGGSESPFEALTPRQREILQLVAEGHTTKAIANLLNLSTKTVETHRSALMQRLDIHDLAGLVRYAIRMGLVTPQN